MEKDIREDQELYSYFVTRNVRKIIFYSTNLF